MWVGVIPIDVGSRAEEGEHLLSEEVIEGVDGRHADRVAEGQLSRVIVQLHPDPGQLPLQVQRGAGPRHGCFTQKRCSHVVGMLPCISANTTAAALVPL